MCSGEFFSPLRTWLAGVPKFQLCDYSSMGFVDSDLWGCSRSISTIEQCAVRHDGDNIYPVYNEYFFWQMSRNFIAEGEAQFYDHSQESYKKSFKCPDCGRCYLHRRSLWRHMKLECGKEPMFQCPHCPKRSKLKENLKQHIIFVHGNFSDRNQPGSHVYRYWNCSVFLLDCSGCLHWRSLWHHVKLECGKELMLQFPRFIL